MDIDVQIEFKHLNLKAFLRLISVAKVTLNVKKKFKNNQGTL